MLLSVANFWFNFNIRFFQNVDANYAARNYGSRGPAASASCHPWGLPFSPRLKAPRPLRTARSRPPPRRRRGPPLPGPPLLALKFAAARANRRVAPRLRRARRQRLVTSGKLGKCLFSVEKKMLILGGIDADHPNRIDLQDLIGSISSCVFPYPLLQEKISMP